MAPPGAPRCWTDNGGRLGQRSGDFRFFDRSGVRHTLPVAVVGAALEPVFHATHWPPPTSGAHSVTSRTVMNVRWSTVARQPSDAISHWNSRISSSLKVADTH